MEDKIDFPFRKKKYKDMKKKSSLSEKMFYVDLGHARGKNRFDRKTIIPKINSKRFYYKDVKEKIQNAQKRLKERIKNCVLLCNCEIAEDKAEEIINKIFLEEFGEKLI